MRKCLILLVMAGVMLYGHAAFSQEEVLFDFETGLQGWEIPNWAFEQPDHVQETISRSEDVASKGDASLRLDSSFPSGRWAGAVAEIMQFFDWSDYSKVACDIYVPADAPNGLRGAIVLTVGDEWKWVEMSRSFDLKPGEWTTLEGDLTPGSIDWRRVQVDDAFRQDVRKITVRVTYNNRPAYEGPVFIDNVRVIR